MPKLARLAPLVLACTSTFATAGEVVFVASDGTGDYLTVADAYAAATDGDVLVVTKQSDSQGILFAGKGVTLINLDDDWDVPSLEVSQLPATSHVVLRGLHLLTNDVPRFSVPVR